MNLKMKIQTLIGITGYAVWGVMAYNDPTQRPDFLRFNIMMAAGTIGLVVRDMASSAPPAPPTDKQGGRAMMAMMSLLVGVGLLLAGCGALNTFTGAQLNAAEAGYAGARQNVKSVDDMKLIAWADAACAMPLGALQRNATGNPYAVSALLTACPIANVGIVQAKDGQVQVQVMQPTPTPPYLGASTTQTPAVKP